MKCQNSHFFLSNIIVSGLDSQEKFPWGQLAPKFSDLVAAKVYQ